MTLGEWNPKQINLSPFCPFIKKNDTVFQKMTLQFLKKTCSSCHVGHCINVVIREVKYPNFSQLLVTSRVFLTFNSCCYFWYLSFFLRHFWFFKRFLLLHFYYAVYLHFCLFFYCQKWDKICLFRWSWFDGREKSGFSFFSCFFLP